MRPPVPRTFLFFLMCLLDHIPGVVAIVGMPLHFLPYDHGRLAPNETPYPSLTNHDRKLYKHFSFYYFFSFYKILFLIYTQRVVQYSLIVGMVEEVLTSQ